MLTFFGVVGLASGSGVFALALSSTRAAPNFDTGSFGFRGLGAEEDATTGGSSSRRGGLVCASNVDSNAGSDVSNDIWEMTRTLLTVEFKQLSPLWDEQWIQFLAVLWFDSIDHVYRRPLHSRGFLFPGRRRGFWGITGKIQSTWTAQYGSLSLLGQVAAC